MWHVVQFTTVLLIEREHWHFFFSLFFFSPFFFPPTTTELFLTFESFFVMLLSPTHHCPLLLALLLLLTGEACASDVVSFPNNASHFNPGQSVPISWDNLASAYNGPNIDCEFGCVCLFCLIACLCVINIFLCSNHCAHWPVRWLKPGIIWTWRWPSIVYSAAKHRIILLDCTIVIVVVRHIVTPIPSHAHCPCWRHTNLLPLSTLLS